MLFFLTDEKKHGPRCWQWITTQLGRPAEQAERVRKQVASQLCYGANRLRWCDLYYRRRPTPVSVTAAQLRQAIANQTVGIVVYYRALDRFPGGNADWAVLKFKVAFNTDNCDISWMAYRNWDGSATGCRAPEARSVESADRVKALLLDPLKDLAAATDKPSVETTVIDRQRDSEEIDTEWSSIEVLLHMPPSLVGGNDDRSSCEAGELFPSADGNSQERWPLVFRLHQRALLTNWYTPTGDELLTHTPAEGSAKAVLDGAGSLFGMGSVDPTLEGLADTPDSVNLPNFNVYVPPIFLHEE